MAHIQVSLRNVGNATVIDVIGDIDLYNSPEMRKALMGVLKEQNASRAIINLTRVRYIDSSGVASLVEALKVARERNARLILFGLSKAAREVLELSRLIKVFEVCENEEQALGAA